jgi:predicted enzyme related to lactoylglutathione lyase
MGVRRLRDNVGNGSRWRIRGFQAGGDLLFADSVRRSAADRRLLRGRLRLEGGSRSRYPSFEDGTGHLIGHIHADMEVVGEAGIRPYVYVESVEETLERITANGGEVVTPAYPEGDLKVAVFRDPTGNVLGIWQRVQR